MIAKITYDQLCSINVKLDRQGISCSMINSVGNNFSFKNIEIGSDASLPAQIVFLAAKIGMRWGNNEKKFFAKIKRNLFASVEKINRKMYKHFQVYHFYSVFLRLYVIKPDPNM